MIGVADPTASAFSVSGKCTCTLLASAFPAGEVTTAPATGRITDWWALDYPGTALSENLVIAQGLLGGTYRSLGESSAQAVTSVTTDFPTSLAIYAGDYIGLDIADTTNAYLIGAASGATYTSFAGQLGSRAAAGTAEGGEYLALGALFYYAPTLNSLGSQSGSSSGGGTVLITGNHLTDTSSVTFGSTPAQSFHVDSNTQITATAPAHAAGATALTVTGPGGTAAASPGYTYVAPKATLSATAIDFGLITLTTGAAQRPVTVTNTGTVPLVLGGVTLSGSSDFTVSGCAAATLGPGASCTAEIGFTPSAAASRLGTLLVRDDAPDSPQAISLGGTGAAPGSGGVSGSASSTTGFSIGRLSGLTLPVTVDARGTVKVVDTARHRQIYTATATGGPGTVKVKLRLTAAASRSRRHHHTITIHARITFKSESVTTTLKIKP